MVTNVLYGSNPYEQNPNPYVSTEQDWKKYAENNGASLIGMDVHYIDCREGNANCIAAKIVKVNSGWETYAQTINCNVKVKFANGTTSTVTVDLSGKTGPTCPNWHFPSHAKNLIPVLNPVQSFPPGTILEDNRGTYNPSAPPTPTFSGSYVIQDTSINNGHCTYMAWNEGTLLVSQELDSCSQDTVPLNELYLGQDSGNVATPVTIPSSNNDDLLGLPQGIKISTAYFGMGAQWFPSGPLAARGVQARFQSNTVTIAGSNCSNLFSSTSQYYFEQVRLTIQSGTYLSLGVVTQCNGFKYFAATKTVGNSQTVIATKPYTPGQHVYSIAQDAIMGEDITSDNYVRVHNMFVASPEHREIMLGTWDYAAIGSYKGQDGRTFYTQLFLRRGNDCSNKPTLTVPIHNPVFEWPKNTYSASVENQNFNKLNAFRAANGRPPVQLNPYLLSKARYRSKDMYLKNYFSHSIPDYGPYQLNPPFWTHWDHVQDPVGTHKIYDELSVDGFCYAQTGENIGWNADAGVPNFWVFRIDEVPLDYVALADQRGGQSVLSGIESHTAANIVIPKLAIDLLAFLDSNNGWNNWFGQAAQVVSKPNIDTGKPVMCGRFVTDTRYLCAQNTSCL